MDKEDFIKLTNNLYRLTLRFPKKEPLRYKIRELANEILANSLRITNQSEYTNLNNPSKKVSKKAENCSPQILEDLEILDSFFEVAKAQNWVSSAEILNVQQEYSKVKEDLKKLPEAKNPSETESSKELLVVPKDSPRTVLGWQISSRQEKILEILKEKEKLQVKDLKEIFPQVSKRTLRRDFEHLFRQGIIERKGERNKTFYQLRIGQESG